MQNKRQKNFHGPGIYFFPDLVYAIKNGPLRRNTSVKRLKPSRIDEDDKTLEQEKKLHSLLKLSFKSRFSFFTINYKKQEQIKIGLKTPGKLPFANPVLFGLFSFYSNCLRVVLTYRIYSCTSRIFLDVKNGASKKSTSTYIREEHETYQTESQKKMPKISLQTSQVYGVK